MVTRVGSSHRAGCGHGLPCFPHGGRSWDCTVTAAPPASRWSRSPGTFHINKSAAFTITFPRRMNE